MSIDNAAVHHAVGKSTHMSHWTFIPILRKTVTIPVSWHYWEGAHPKAGAIRENLPGDDRNHIWVPAGARNDNDHKVPWPKYKAGDKMPEKEKMLQSKHQVFLAHVASIDEQYYFEDADDARWFYAEGYKQRL